MLPLREVPLTVNEMLPLRVSGRLAMLFTPTRPTLAAVEGSATLRRHVATGVAPPLDLHATALARARHLDLKASAAAVNGDKDVGMEGDGAGT